MKTAIIGLGNIGTRVATALANGGQDIIVSDRNLAKAKEFAAKLGSRAKPTSIDEAVKEADVVILAIWFDGIREFVTAHHSALAGKIVVDPSNPIVPDGKGGFRKTIPGEQSAGKINAALLPEGAEPVKAFGTLGAQSLGTAANRSPERAVLFYATDYPEAGRAIARLITAAGFAPVSVGGIDQSIRIEVGGDLHEFGKLGRLVSVKEAETLV